MKTYTVAMKYETWFETQVEADDENQAELIAWEALRQDNDNDYLHSGTWTEVQVESVTPDGLEMTSRELKGT